MLPTSNLRYRLRSIKHLPSNERPFLTLALTHADQATRRAIRALGDPSERRRTFMATEGEQLAGDHRAVAWQQCGHGMGMEVKIEPGVSLEHIVASTGWLVDRDAQDRRDGTPPAKRQPTPDPYSLYPSNLRASMPDPTEQVKDSLAVQLTRAEKEALDLLAAWPLCSRGQLAGLMGGVTLRRVNQALRPLRQHDLVQEDESRLMLTDRGLTCLARRDRAAVGLTLDRWSAQPAVSNPRVYAGTAVRALTSQPRHHGGVVSFAASLTAEVARSPDHDLFDLLPTHRSSIGYRRGRTNYMIHPDASFTLEYKGKWLPFLLEFERRATTPKRIPRRLYDERYGFAPPTDRIVVTTGGSAGLILAFLAAFDVGDLVALADPGYPAYRNTLQALGLKPVLLPTTGETRFQPTVAMLEALKKPIQGLIVASPSNPTGTMVPRDTLEALVAYCDSRGIRVVSDEIYHGITYGEPATSVAAFSPNAVVINGFSKYFAMTGWRLGWMVVPEDLARAVERLTQNLFISPPALSQQAALVAFDCQDELEANVARYARNRSIVQQSLPAAGFGALAPCDGAFYAYADVSGLTDDSEAFCRRMLAECGVAATPGIDFDTERGRAFVRFSYAGAREEVEGACAALERWLTSSG